MANKDVRDWIDGIKAAGELKIITGAEPKEEIGGIVDIYMRGIHASTNRKLADLGITQANSQTSQLTDQLSYEINGCLIGQPAFCIKLCLGVCYVDMRYIHWDHIQRHADVTEVKLPARSAERTHRCAEHCARFAVCWWMRRP